MSEKAPSKPQPQPKPQPKPISRPLNPSSPRRVHNEVREQNIYSGPVPPKKD